MLLEKNNVFCAEVANAVSRGLGQGTLAVILMNMASSRSEFVQSA
jgi:hypothetical protein